ncbi:MAG: spore coat associated protein CotJA [Ruminococcus sp.]|nr:spore coat associated protein CotJA [Ruminococcus sp.]
MPSSRFPKDTPIGMAYVPYQFWEKPYDDELALARGTIFPSLDKPFIGEEAVRHGR